MTEGLSAGDAARRLGVAVTTLRSWHHRYGIGPGDYVPGRHRRYTEGDMARLEQMVRLLGEGIDATRAARTVLGAEVADTGRAGGGRTIAVAGGSDASRGLARAAMRLDTPAMARIIGTAIAGTGVVSTWTDVICPVLVGLHPRTDPPEPMIAVEHLLSRAVSESMATVPRPATDDSPHILLACAAEEQHTLALETLAAALAESGCSCRILGPRTPSPALVHAIGRTGPAAVLVWSQVPETGAVEQFTPLLALRPRPIVIAAGGPGWPDDALPASVERPTDLPTALDILIAGIGSTAHP